MRDDVEEPPSQRHSTQSYHGYFERHQKSLLSIAARLKHPAFVAEREWRLISKVHDNLLDPAIKYRVSPSRLVPYVEFFLPIRTENHLSLDRVYTGPAMEHNLSFSSLSAFLTNRKVSPREGIFASRIPLRNW